MEGMISEEMLVIHQEYLNLLCDRGTHRTPTSWAKGLIFRLIEITHGQWLYRNVHVHDTVTGSHATHRKEELQNETEDQIQMGGEGLAEDDKYLLEINLEDMETTYGEIQEYWILVIQSAREARILREGEINASTDGNTA